MRQKKHKMKTISKLQALWNIEGATQMQPLQGYRHQILLQILQTCPQNPQIKHKQPHNTQKGTKQIRTLHIKVQTLQGKLESAQPTNVMIANMATKARKMVKHALKELIPNPATNS